MSACPSRNHDHYMTTYGECTVCVKQSKDGYDERIAALEGENAELRRIKEAADVLYSEANEYDFDSGLGMGADQQYWDDLANALFPDDSAEVIVADLERMQAKVLERFEEELNRPEFLPCGHHHSLMLKSAETGEPGEPLYCEYCDCISSRNDYKTERDEARAEVERLRDVLRNIALAGMSAPPQMHEDEVTNWHARRAWEFIGIAARGLDAALAAKEKP